MFTMVLLSALSTPAQYPPPPPLRPRLRIQLDLQRPAFDWARQQACYDRDEPRGYGGGYRDRDRDLPPYPPAPRGGRWETVYSYRGETYLVPTFDDFEPRNGNGNGYRNGNGGGYGRECYPPPMAYPRNGNGGGYGRGDSEFEFRRYVAPRGGPKVTEFRGRD